MKCPTQVNCQGIVSSKEPKTLRGSGQNRQLRKGQSRGWTETVERTGSAKAGLWNGLSRMKGNFHVRFLGEGAAAMPLPYPTVKILGARDSRPRSRTYVRSRHDRTSERLRVGRISTLSPARKMSGVASVLPKTLRVHARDYSQRSASIGSSLEALRTG